MNSQTLITAAVLGLFTLFGTGLLLIVDHGTKSRIQANEQAGFRNLLNEILPASSHDNNMLDDSIIVPASPLLGTKIPSTVYLAKLHGKPVAAVFTSIAPNGYSGAIRLLIGVDSTGRITGVRVLSHKETPGLGDPIEIKKSNWILKFNGKSLSEPAEEKWAVKKDGGAFDAITGATITSRAVVGAVGQTLKYSRQHARIFTAEPEPQP